MDRHAQMHDAHLRPNGFPQQCTQQPRQGHLDPEVGGIRKRSDLLALSLDHVEVVPAALQGDVGRGDAEGVLAV